MNPFSVGDKVKFKDGTMAYEVGRVDGNFVNTSTNGAAAGWWPASSFEPVAKFKIGDRVVHTDCFADKGVGAVYGLPSGAGCGAAYAIKFPDCGIRYCSEENLRLAPPADRCFVARTTVNGVTMMVQNVMLDDGDVVEFTLNPKV